MAIQFIYRAFVWVKDARNDTNSLAMEQRKSRKNETSLPQIDKETHASYKHIIDLDID